MPKCSEVWTTDWSLQQKWLKKWLGPFQNYLDRRHLYTQEYLFKIGMGQAHILYTEELTYNSYPINIVLITGLFYYTNSDFEMLSYNRNKNKVLDINYEQNCKTSQFRPSCPHRPLRKMTVNGYICITVFLCYFHLEQIDCRLRKIKNECLWSGCKGSDYGVSHSPGKADRSKLPTNTFYHSPILMPFKLW